MTKQLDVQNFISDFCQNNLFTCIYNSFPVKENNKIKAKIQEPIGTGYIFIRGWLYQRKKDSKDQIFCEYFDPWKYVIVLAIITQTQIVDFINR